MIEQWRQAIWRDLFTPASRQTRLVDFEVNALLRGDRRTRFQAYTLGRQWGLLSANYIRRLENMNPIDGGDVYFSSKEAPGNPDILGSSDPAFRGDPSGATNRTSTGSDY